MSIGERKVEQLYSIILEKLTDITDNYATIILINNDLNDKKDKPLIETTFRYKTNYNLFNLLISNGSWDIKINTYDDHLGINCFFSYEIEKD